MCTYNLVLYQQGINILGKPIIFLVLVLGVYLEKMIVIAYGKCIYRCVRRLLAVGLEFTLQQAMKAHREGRGITLLFI